jgi:hypothetical protein
VKTAVGAIKAPCHTQSAYTSRHESNPIRTIPAIGAKGALDIYIALAIDDQGITASYGYGYATGNHKGGEIVGAAGQGRIGSSVERAVGSVAATRTLGEGFESGKADNGKQKKERDELFHKFRDYR